MSTDTPTLASFVTTRRKKLNLRQSDLANALGYTVQAISKFESGESQIAISSLPALANLLALSVDDLLACREGETPAVGAEPLNQDLLRANLVTLRTNAHLSIAKEAEILGVSKNTIIHYEAGTSLPTFEAFGKILSYYSLTPSTFLYGTVAPITPIAPLTPAPSPDLVAKKKSFFQSPLGFLLLAIAIIGISLGITLPLIYRKASAINNGSSVSLSASNGDSTSLSSNGSSNNSTSSTSVDSTPDLSINIPGLKHLYLETKETKATHSFQAAPGDYVVEVCAEGFAFTEENSDQYKFEVYITEDAKPLNVAVTDTDVYTEKSVHVPSTMPNMGLFTLSVRAFNVLHPKEYAEETQNNLQFSVLNPSGADVNENFPGLKYLDITFDNIHHSASLKPGAHTLGYVSTPENYFEDNGCNFTFEITTPLNGVTLSKDTKTVTIDSSVTGNKSCSVSLHAVNKSAMVVSSNGFFHVDNPDGDLDSEVFPGIKDVKLLYQGSYTATLGPGTYSLDAVIENTGTLSLDNELWLDTMGMINNAGPDVIEFTIADKHKPVYTVVIHDVGASGQVVTYWAALWRKNHSVPTIGHQQFILTIA
jgi:transcriptional regulator with XRE-family HTH domain